MGRWTISRKNRLKELTAIPYCDSARRLLILVDECQENAARRDVVTMMEYITNNKVKGTAATGNFPLKHCEALGKLFVNPFEMFHGFSDLKWPVRTETELNYLYFLHILAHVSGLIVGGESREWKVTPLGGKFLKAEPVEQIWHLFNVWWHAINWAFFCWRGGYPEKFQLLLSNVLEYILPKYSAGTKVDISGFLKQYRLFLTQGSQPISEEEFLDYGESWLRSMLLDPMSDLGMFDLHKEEPDPKPDSYNRTIAFSLTTLGEAVFNTLVDWKIYIKRHRFKELDLELIKDNSDKEI